jgi:hypothetical protein
MMERLNESGPGRRNRSARFDYLNTLGVTGTPPQFLSSGIAQPIDRCRPNLFSPTIIAASPNTTNFLDKN